MSRNAKTAAVKGRETKLNKKSNEELIQIVLKKDKIERSLNNQIKSLKAEVNSLSTCVKNCKSDMEGTYQSLEAYKDKCKALQEKNDALKIESKDNYSLYIEENKKVVEFKEKVNIWKFITFIATAIAIVAITVAVL